MEIRDMLSPLIVEIESERDWRVGEFRRVKSIYLQFENIEKYRSTYSLMCIPIIYAHWEGFCISIFRLVANYINSKQLTYAEINNSLFTYSHDKTYNYLKGKQGFSQRCKFSNDFLKTITNSPVRIGKKFDCKSNLNYKILLELLEVFGIHTDKFNDHERNLDKLVNVRNAIAHGEHSIVVGKNMIVEFIEIVVKLYDEIIILFSEYLLQERYLR